MSRGAPPTTPLSAVPNQVPQQLAATGQVANQSAAIAQRGQIAREQMELQNQQAQDRNILSAAALQERARSQQEYRELMERQGEASRQIQRDSMAQRSQLAEQDRQMKLAVMKQQQDLMNESRALKMKELEVGAEGQEELRAALLRNEEMRHDQAVRMSQATADMEGSSRDLSDTRRKVSRAMTQQTDAALVRSNRLLGEFASGLGEFVDDMTFYGGTEDQGDFFAFVGGEILKDLDPRTRAKAFSLGLDISDIDNVGGAAERYGIRGSIDVQSKLEGRVAQLIGNSFGGDDQTKAGAISQIISEAFANSRNLDGDNDRLDAVRGEMFARLQEQGVTDTLTLDAVLNGAAKALSSQVEAFRASDVSRDFADASRRGVNFDEEIEIGGTKMTRGEAIIRRNIYDSQNMRGINVLGTSGEDIESIRALARRLGGEGLSAREIEGLLGDDEYSDFFSLVGDDRLSGLRDATGRVRDVERRQKDITREGESLDRDERFGINRLLAEILGERDTDILDFMAEQERNREDRLGGL